MLKWAARKLGVGAVELHLDDLAEYIEQLARFDPQERRQIAAEVFAFRQLMESKGIAVGQPMDYVRHKPAMLLRIEEYVESTARTEPFKSLGMAAWLHTLRAARHIVDGQRPETFRELTLKMWRELGREAPAEAGAAFYPVEFDPARA